MKNYVPYNVVKEVFGNINEVKQFLVNCLKPLYLSVAYTKLGLRYIAQELFCSWCTVLPHASLLRFLSLINIKTLH